MCENMHASSKYTTCYRRTEQYVQVELIFAGESPPSAVIPSRMSATAVRADEEEVVVQNLIEKTQH